jgi:hypothetical protein
MRKFKSVGQAQKFLGAHVAVSNLFNLGKHLIRAKYCRGLRVSAFNEWKAAVVRVVSPNFPRSGKFICQNPQPCVEPLSKSRDLRGLIYCGIWVKVWGIPPGVELHRILI